MLNGCIGEIKKCESSVCENAESFLQSAMWGEFKSLFDWESCAFLIDWTMNGLREKRPLLVLSRRFSLVPGIGFSFAYVPWGPALPENFPAAEKQNALAQLAEKLKPFFSSNTAFIRFDPPWYTIEQEAESEETAMESAGFRKAAATVQPPDTVLINLVSSCEEMLAAMKPKWRYNISLAGKKGVQVDTNGTRKLEIFYRLLKETAVRDGIAIHKIDYYKSLFDLCEKRNNSGGIKLRLYTATHEGDDLAAIIVLFAGDTATYLYGASSNIKRNLMAPYALQWKAIQDAKASGCKCYDLFGIPPNEDPNHPMAGLYRFKTGFGGLIIHRPGSWDYQYKPVIYRLFNLAESARKKLRDRKKNRNSKLGQR
jgi:lipid II:glycine glycyltransferase (peptidoglycan interpeptide bridge formation enzyme)